MEYKDLLKDGRWQIRKSQIMARDNYRCQCCGASAEFGITLNVHHKNYRHGYLPWEYADDELVTLCEECHLRVHGLLPDDEEPEMTIEKYEQKCSEYRIHVGDFFTYEHSDFDNFGVIYYIDFKTMIAKMASIDVGSSYDTLWINEININTMMAGCYELRDCQYASIDDESDLYADTFLFYVFENILNLVNGHEKVYFYFCGLDFNEADERKAIIDSIPEMRKNNSEIERFFSDYDYRSIHQRTV